MKLPKHEALELVRTCCRVLDDKKAGDLRVLDVSAQSSITDYLIIATATSEPHLRALRIELEKAFDGAGVRMVGKEIVQESGWVILDAFDVMVHLFLAEPRERFGLERLWRDAVEINPGKLLSAPAKPRRSSKRPAPKSAPARRGARKK